MSRVACWFAPVCFLGFVGCALRAPDGPGVGADADPDAVASEFVVLSGVWVYERMVAQGNEIDMGNNRSHIVIDRRSLVREVYSGTGAGRRRSPVHSTLWIDPTVTPKQFDDDVKLWNGTKRRPGIYKLEGDRLTICWNNIGTERPQTFEAPPGSEFTLTVLRRRGRE